MMLEPGGWRLEEDAGSLIRPGQTAGSKQSGLGSAVCAIYVIHAKQNSVHVEHPELHHLTPEIRDTGGCVTTGRVKIASSLMH